MYVDTKETSQALETAIDGEIDDAWALHLAAEKGQLDKVLALLSAGTNVDVI